MNTTQTTTLVLPRRYAQDWWSRYDGDDVPEPKGKAWNSPTVTVTLTSEALADLISDVEHYTHPVMRRDFMESCPDVVRSADATRRRLEKAGML